MTLYQYLKRKGLRPLPGILFAAALALPLSGCVDTDELVAVEDPEQLRPEDLNNIGAVPALVNGALRQFVGGYVGLGDDAFLSASSVITDETYYGDSFTTREAADKRTMQAPVLTNITDVAFGRLQQARFNARRAFSVVEQFTTNQTALADSLARAQLRNIEGLVYVTLSEGWCGAVPFSRLPDVGAIDPTAVEEGTPLTTLQMNDTAVTRFNQALAFAPTFAATAGPTSATALPRRLASIGKARALLNLGKYAEAAAAVPASVVPTTFVFRLEQSSNSSTQYNSVFSLQGNGRYGVSNLEGGASRPDTVAPQLTAAGAEGLPFRGLNDPRVPWQGRPVTGNSCFSAVFCWTNQNYPTNDSDVPLASGVEARLIEAEAQLFAGDAAAMMATLNALRANAAALITALYPDQRRFFGTVVPTAPVELAPLTDPGTAEGRLNLLFQERALWLYQTGHRQGDLRRLVRQYGRPSNTVFPSGAHFRGGTYGNDVAYPVPFDEGNNTLYNPAACVTTQA
jgi:hypothetical protein